MPTNSPTALRAADKRQTLPRPGCGTGPTSRSSRNSDRAMPALATFADLETLSRDELLALWVTVFDTPVPKGLSQPFLQRYLAFEIQSHHLGGLPAPLAARMARIEAQEEPSRTPALRHGGRLLREWNGVTHVVDVTHEGYLWQGQRHRSLSAIAQAITGAHWSGPRFFGLSKPAGDATRKPKTAKQKGTSK